MNCNVLDIIFTKCNKNTFNGVMEDMRYSIKTQMNSQTLHRYSITIGSYRYSYCYTDGLRKTSTGNYISSNDVGVRCSFSLNSFGTSFKISGHNLSDRHRTSVVTHFYQRGKKLKISVRKHSEALREMRRCMFGMSTSYKN